MTRAPVILAAGGSGQVARALVEQAAGHPVRLVALGRPTLDILAPSSIAAAMEHVKPDLVINAAAYTAVDQAEGDEAGAYALNEEAAGELAAAAARASVPILHLSTDYVFDGDKPAPYVETDPVSPLGVYGRSKLAGERVVATANADSLILRTAWVYSPFGKNFAKTMLRVASQRDELGVVMDQIGNPTYAGDIAEALLTIAGGLLSGKTALKPGVYHMTADGEASWADFASLIFETSADLGGPTARVNCITSADYPTPTKRPANSRLDCSLLKADYGVALPPWQDSTRDCVRRLIQTRGWDA